MTLTCTKYKGSYYDVIIIIRTLTLCTSFIFTHSHCTWILFTNKTGGYIFDGISRIWRSLVSNLPSCSLSWLCLWHNRPSSNIINLGVFYGLIMNDGLLRLGFAPTCCLIFLGRGGLVYNCFLLEAGRAVPREGNTVTPPPLPRQYHGTHDKIHIESHINYNFILFNTSAHNFT